MPANALSDGKIKIRPAKCVRHPAANQEMFFCLECTQTICKYCENAIS